MKIKPLLFLVFMTMLSSVAYTQEAPEASQEMSDEEFLALFQEYLDSIEATLKYQTGEIKLRGNFASIQVPAGFRFLDGDQSETVLVEMWGNPPDDIKPLGMLIPEKYSLTQDSTYAINITYSEEGYIDDSDASTIDYDELLETIRADIKLENEYRIENDYPTYELVGWASPPFYDAENKKLHWAKELNFEGDQLNTLNYNIRILGRKGYLNLNAIGGMYSLGEIKDNIDPILNSVNFTAGNQYSDFNPDMDKVAAIGIGGLIAGKVLAKAGILAKLGIILVKFWKVILLGIVGIGAGLRKIAGYGGKNQPS